MLHKIAAFGALNQESYEEFAEQIAKAAQKKMIVVEVVSAGPYPNAAAVSAPGRPLRAEALENEEKKQELFKAVAADAKSIEAEKANLRVMPCMSMIGFHDGVEKALSLDILRLSDALAAKYKSTPKLGVIHMRPARQRIQELFGDRAVLPNEELSAKLLRAEEEAKQKKSSAPVEAAMKEIVEDFRFQNVRNVLFARADAPKAKKSGAAKVPGMEILTYFDILAEAAVEKLAAKK